MRLCRTKWGAPAQNKMLRACSDQNDMHLRRRKSGVPAQNTMGCACAIIFLGAHAHIIFKYVHVYLILLRMRILFLYAHPQFVFVCTCASYFCKRMRIFFLCAHANLISLVCAYAFYLFMRSHILYLYTYSRFIVVCPRVFHFCSYASFRVSFCSHRKPFFECCIFLKFEKQYSSEGVLEVVEKLLLYYYF